MQQDVTRETVRDWLQKIIDRWNITPRQLAVKAEVSPSTIYRALDLQSDFTPTLTTIGKVAAAFKVAAPGMASPAASAASGFHEPEMQPLDGTAAPQGARQSNNQTDWTIATRALELAGVLPGDVVRFDMAAAPHDGDVVCAQVYNFERGSAETIIRQVKGPYLIARTADPSVDLEPLLVDGRRVAVAGVMVHLLRRRAA